MKSKKEKKTLTNVQHLRSLLDQECLNDFRISDSESGKLSNSLHLNSYGKKFFCTGINHRIYWATI